MNEPLDRLLAWERALLQAVTLDQWLARVATTPEGAGARVLLADATHELRPLVLGSHDDGAALPVAFVPSLAGLAPHLLTLRGAWRGDYHAADHALLFPASAGLQRLAIVPLARAGQVVGLYTAVTGAASEPFAGLAPALLDHAADVIIASLDRHLERARVLRGGLVDPLTGWNSPRYLQARLREELARAQRDRGCVACLVADVDRLQAVNDEFGYGAGDLALQEVATRIESEVRASDAAGRLGSDEFAVVLPGTDAAGALPLAERVLAAVRGGPVELGGGVARELRVSIGIASCRPQAGQDRKMLSDQLLADAIAALHRAKQAGGDRCESAPG